MTKTSKVYEENERKEYCCICGQRLTGWHGHDPGGHHEDGSGR